METNDTYVYLKSCFVGCPLHEGTGASTLCFCNSVSEYLDNLKKEFKDYEYQELYSTKTRNIVATPHYYYHTHSVDFVEVSFEEEKMRIC